MSRKSLSLLSFQQFPHLSFSRTYFHSRQHTHTPSYARPLHSYKCHPVHSQLKSDRAIASTALFQNMDSEIRQRKAAPPAADSTDASSTANKHHAPLSSSTSSTKLSPDSASNGLHSREESSSSSKGHSRQKSADLQQKVKEMAFGKTPNGTSKSMAPLFLVHGASFSCSWRG